jgi:transketolase
METFGASGPQKALYEHFGFTPENVVERAKKVVEGSRG